MTSQATEANVKKMDPFENLTKEELIKKCKQFLGIAQKAKQAKDDLTEEIETLKTKIQKLVKEPQDTLITMQEIVDNLTQQKLQLVVDYDTLKREKNIVDNKMKTYEDELIDTNLKVKSLETESESYSRQINRLSDENEQLLTHLNTLEKEVNELKVEKEEQTILLLSFEKKNTSIELNKICNITDEMSVSKDLCKEKTELSKSFQQIEELKSKCDNFETELLANKTILDEKDTKSNEIELLQMDIKQLNIIVNNLNLDIQSKISTIELLTKTNNDVNTDLNTVNKELIRVQNKFESLTEELKSTNKSKDMYNEKLKSHHSKLIKAFADLKELKQTKSKLLLIVEDYSKYISLWQSDILGVSNRFTEELKNRNTEVEYHKKQTSELKKNNNELNEKLLEICSKDKENISFIHELNNNMADKIKVVETTIEINKSLTEENNNLVGKLEKKEQDIILVSEEIKNLSAAVDRLSKDKTVLSEENTSLTENINILNNELSSFKKEFSNLRNQLSMSKRENVELLKEMNDMNQALKERGETISKQQEYTQELIRKIEVLEQEFSNIKQQKDKSEEELNALKTKTEEYQIPTVMQELNLQLEDKKCRISTLEKEIQQLKESFNSNVGVSTHDSTCGDSETMSTSTISRLDEAARLRDLEGSWEERYTKLRALALKLKGKVKALSEQLTQEKMEKSDIQTKITTVTRNLQKIQTEHDKLQDKFDIINKENKNYIKEITTLLSDNESVKQNLQVSSVTISKLEHELEIITKEKSGSNSAVKQYINQIQNLKKETERNNNVKKELENKISILESSLTEKKDELEAQIKAHNETKDKLQKFEKEIKKNSVLSLEMEDYERSLKEILQKLDKKQELVINLEEEISSQKKTINSINDQLRDRDDEITSEETRNQELSQQLLETKTKLSEFESIVSQKDNRIREILRSLENTKSTNEEINAELSQIVSQDQKQIEALKSDKEHLTSKMLGLEGKVRELMKNLRDREQEVNILNEEFSGYKVRAQSVLRQNQSRDVVLEEKLTEEVEELKAQVALLKTKFDNNMSDLLNMNEKFELAEMEKSQNILLCQDLEKSLVQEKSNNHILVERQQNLVAEHREAMRTQKVHADTLAHCYKQQLAEQEARHIKELTEIQAAHTFTSTDILNKLQDDHLDITSMLREDGEGSESIDSSSNNLNSKIIPLSLDKLLNMDVENLSRSDYEAELVSCRKQLLECETKVSHLSDLLADAEQDLAKHSQLNQLLKEEIRRHQRSVEREKHAENLEYLKNIVFKFLTTSSGDERLHLIPVLNTILKLSPEETQKLSAVIRGPDTSLKRLGSYLPLWNTPNN